MTDDTTKENEEEVLDGAEPEGEPTVQPDDTLVADDDEEESSDDGVVEATPESDDASMDTATEIIVNLRPEANGIAANLVRLGFSFNNTNSAGTQTWLDYTSGCRATFNPDTNTTVDLQDKATGISRTLTLAQLQKTSTILTVGNM